MSNSEDKKIMLQRKRDELIERLDNINKDYQQGLDPDSEERAIQLENAEVLDGIATATQEELNRIEKELSDLS